MKEKSTKITDVLALLTLAVFALCLLTVLLGGANVYRDLVDSGRENHSRRTALRYLTTRVHQAEVLQTGDFQGCDALILEENLDGEIYLTRIYCYDGWLRELYAVPGAELSAAEGQPLLEAADFACLLEGDLLTLQLGQDRLVLYLPQNREVLP